MFSPENVYNGVIIIETVVALFSMTLKNFNI